MRALVQRVSAADVKVDGSEIGQIGPGLLVFVCAMQGDTTAEAEKMAARLVKLRIFKDDGVKMNLSLQDTGGAALVVSQFTLAADTARGNRPGFSAAAAPDIGRALYEHFIATLRWLGVHVATGSFGADMAVHLVNDGPVTLWLDNGR